MANGKFNEGKACDAVIKRLELREGKTRQNVRLPERDKHPAPIEITFRLSDREFALEHTGIEPFAGHVQLQAQAEKHFDPIQTMLAGKLPPNVFDLMIPARATQHVSARELPEVQRALAAWVEEMAPTLPISPYARYVTLLHKVRPPGVPFSVSLYRLTQWVFRLDCKLPISSVNLMIGERAASAPRAKRNFQSSPSGASQALNDIQLTNPQVVYDVLAKIEPEFPERPDEIYLVGSWATEWFIHALRIGERDYYELSEAGQCMTEVDPATLVDLTGR